MDERYNQYHLDHKQHDLLREREQDRLAKIAACEQQMTWQRKLRDLWTRASGTARESAPSTTSTAGMSDLMPCTDAGNRKPVRRTG